MTHNDNRSIEERFYGDGKVIGKEIDEKIMQEAKHSSSKKQLDSTRRTFLNFVKDRVTSTTPNGDSPRFNSGHITEQLLNMNSGLKTSGNARNGSLPRLAGGLSNHEFPSKALNSEYSSFVTSTFINKKGGVA